MEIDEFKTCLKSYYETNNIFKKFSLATQDTNKSSERLNLFTTFHDKIGTLSKDSAERLIEDFNIQERNKFINFILEYKDIDHVDKNIRELSDYISKLKDEKYADTMIMGVDISTKLNKYSLRGTPITRDKEGILYFDKKQILEIPSKFFKEMSNKIIIYNSGRFLWKTQGISVIISKLKGNGYNVILKSFHEFKIPLQYIKIINLID